MVMESSHILRNFGHCVINWKIENFCLTTCKEDWIIYSPDFYVKGRETTKWRFVLNPKSKENDTFYMILHLERLKSDPGPDVVWANWKLLLLDIENNVYFSSDSKNEFIKESTYGVRQESTTVVVNNLRPFDVDTLNVRCQIIVYHEDSARKYMKSSSFSLQSLSHDLGVIYEARKDCDIVLNVDGQEIRAHKAILHSRNRNFAKLLDKDPTKREISLGIVDYEAMDKVMTYLYSGNLELVLAKPSVSLYECVMFFNIDELKCYYAPDELILKTEIGVHEYEFVWLITGFSTRNEDHILSPVLNEEISETTWQLSLYPNGYDDDVEHVAIFAKIVEGMKPMDVCLECAIMDINRDFFFLKRLSKCIEGHEMLGFNNFVERHTLENSSLLNGDTLRIVVKLRMSTGNQILSIGGRMTSFVCSNAEQNSFDSLSIDMENMCKYGAFKDIILYAEESPFKVHKCVLAARSRIFSNMISKMKDGQAYINIPNIRSYVLRILISYMYCGKLKGVESDLPQIYEAAESFGIPSLKATCSRNMQKNLRVETVCNVLVFSHRKKDSALTQAALKFISLNAQTVQGHETWNVWMEGNSYLCSKVAAYLKRKSEESGTSTESQN